ncbi:hypothetical protein J3B02_005991, partial [Coemansia erecta]
ILEWAKDLAFASLTIGGIQDGTVRPLGSICGMLQSMVGPEIWIPWIERINAATVELIIPKTEWAVTYQYLADKGMCTYPTAEPAGPRPGGSENPAKAHKEAYERWSKWAAGEKSRPFTKLGRYLMQKYPLSKASEPGEIVDWALPVPGDGWINPLPKNCNRPAPDMVAEEAKCRHNQAKTQNSFEVLSEGEDMDTDTLYQVGPSSEEGPQKGLTH